MEQLTYLSKTIVLVFLLAFSFEAWSQDSLGYFSGVASYYHYSGRGNCGFKAPPKPVLTAAVNTKQYDTAALCGACLLVIGAKDSVVVRVEDRCPGCKYGGLDLSREAFERIDDWRKGRVKVRWRVVACPQTNAMRLFVKKGSGTGWSSFIVLNHQWPVQNVAYWRDSLWLPVPRYNHNYFNLSRAGTMLVRLRFTDMYNCETVFDSVQLVSGKYVELKAVIK